MANEIHRDQAGRFVNTRHQQENNTNMARPTTVTHPTYFIPRTPIPVRDTRAASMAALANPHPDTLNPFPAPPRLPTFDDTPAANQTSPRPTERIPVASRARQRQRRTQVEVLGSQPAGIHRAVYTLDRVVALETKMAELIGRLDDNSLNEILKVRPDLNRFRPAGQ